MLTGPGLWDIVGFKNERKKDGNDILQKEKN
jgi:hypothetical protein